MTDRTFDPRGMGGYRGFHPPGQLVSVRGRSEIDDFGAPVKAIEMLIKEQYPIIAREKRLEQPFRVEESVIKNGYLRLVARDLPAVDCGDSQSSL